MLATRSIFLVAGLLALLTACGAVSDLGTNAKEATESTARLPGESSPAEAALLDQIATEISPDVTVRLVDVPADFLGPAKAMGLAADGVWLDINLPAEQAPEQPSLSLTPVDAVAYVRLRWEGELILGAYHDAALARGMRAVIGASFLANGVLTDRGLVTLESGTETVLVGQSTPVSSDVAHIRNSVSKGAAINGMTVESIEFEKGLAPAPVIQLRSSTPRAAVERTTDWLPDLVGQGEFTLEGWFIIVLDETNTPFYVTAVANRAGGGISWVRADLGRAIGDSGTGLGSDALPEVRP